MSQEKNSLRPVVLGPLDWFVKPIDSEFNEAFVKLGSRQNIPELRVLPLMPSPCFASISLPGLSHSEEILGASASQQLLNLLTTVFRLIEGEGNAVRFYQTHDENYVARFRNLQQAEAFLIKIQDYFWSLSVEVNAEHQLLIFTGIQLCFGISTSEVDAHDKKTQHERTYTLKHSQARRRAHARKPYTRLAPEHEISVPLQDAPEDHTLPASE